MTNKEQNEKKPREQSQREKDPFDQLPEEEKAELSAAAKNREMNRESEEKQKDMAIYWAPAKNYQADNFKPEEWSGSRMTKRAVALKFTEHVFVTEDPKEIAFIEGLDDFKANIIIRCKEMGDVQILTEAQASEKSITVRKSNELTMEEFVEDEGGKVTSVRRQRLAK